MPIGHNALIWMKFLNQIYSRKYTSQGLQGSNFLSGYIAEAHYPNGNTYDKVRSVKLIWAYKAHVSDK